MKNKDYQLYINLSPEDLNLLAKRRGWVMSFVGYVVYRLLTLFGQQAKNYKGICEYFEIGSSWGGVSLGYFFICDKNCSDYIKRHEVGHCIQNAAVGGFTMFAYSIASAVRCGWRKFIPSKRSYYDWFFEGDASKIGSLYVERMAVNTKE